MKYFGIEIFDGKPLKHINLVEELSLEDQWFNLTQDITCIDYMIHGTLDFSIDVGWYPSAEVTPNSYFRTCIIEGKYTDGSVFFEKKSRTIEEMKLDLKKAISLIQSFKKMQINEILQKIIRDTL